MLLLGFVTLSSSYQIYYYSGQTKTEDGITDCIPVFFFFFFLENRKLNTSYLILSVPSVPVLPIMTI